MSEVYPGTPMGHNPTSSTSTRQWSDDGDEGAVSDAEFREKVILHQEPLIERHPFW